MTFIKLRPGGAAAAGDADARPRGGRDLRKSAGAASIPPRGGGLRAGAAALALAVAIGVAACGGSGEGVNLVGYSTPQEAYEDALQPKFGETGNGDGVEFSNSFGSSGDQSRAVEAGQSADVVHFSLETDMTRLVDAGMVADDWQEQGDYNGIVENSVVVFAVRPGNPQGIEDWDDLTGEGVEVLTPNPFTSGGARWNLMAAYGAQLNAGASHEEALGFVEDLLRNVSVQDESARDSLNTFLNGKGDVLLAYENEAIQAQDADEELEYVVPDDTILIETPIAVTEDADPDAQAFVDFLYSEQGQQLWADYGYRPVDPKVLKANEDKFRTPPGLFTIADLGGWEQVATEFFETEGEPGAITEIQENLGEETG